MARDINKRLTSLKARRSGTDRLSRVGTEDSLELLRKSLVTEDFQKRAANQPNTRYALGAMQEVSSDYTRISIETAERVGKQLKQGLTRAGFSVDFRLQGSVPLNTHIRGVSDVDLLNLETSFLTYIVAGARSRAGYYTSSGTRTSIGVLMSLRSEAEKLLKSTYPAATVDTAGGKAINVSGGSLARPVDVVPSHWNDTMEYQTSLEEHVRGVTILNKKVPETVDNLPFLHIKRVSEQDNAALGGLKKSIRLCKNVKSDAEDEGSAIALPSFDIASIMFNADLQALRSGAFYELSILAETQRYLDWLYHNKDEAGRLFVPDRSRRIFDSAKKFDGLRSLSVEMDDLAKEVAKEQSYLLAFGDGPSLAQSRDVLAKAYIPAG